MNEWSSVGSLVTPGGTITFNATSGDRLILDPEACSWTLDTRLVADPAPQASGAVLFPGLDGPAHLVLVGWLLPSTDTAAGRNTLYNSLETAVNSILAEDGTLNQTPTGGSARSLTVRREVALTAVGAYRKRFAFGLIAPDPTWS